MGMHTYGVGMAVTPTVVQTWLDHYLNRKKRKQKPTAHISYDVALHLIQKFLIYASHHTVEDVQAFTSQWIPTPTWVHVERLTIPEATIEQAATTLVTQLGPEGIRQVGGKTWWKWRRDNSPLKADWIEMKSDWKQRERKKEKCTRVMFYVHGGAYFFGSVDEHGYQLQRHARKLKARVFAPRYRLSPQFPFPCGLHDCLSAYLHLLTLQDPTTIVLAGDSAGGGMVTSMLVVLRDQGLPLPAGAILISPWVDLTHSFPSVSGDNPFDYIPPYGFMQKPSIAWPPPNADDLANLKRQATGDLGNAKPALEKQTTQEAAAGVIVKDPEDGTILGANAATEDGAGDGPSTSTAPSKYMSLMIDGKEVYLRDQIQMYATNEQLAHPLVSPVTQASLGGLPPLLILAGGGEMLRDEQIYLAHKAANPTKYTPSEAHLERTPGAREQIDKYKPTRVQLQVWDDMCHVAPTLSFTRPAKYMYRSIAQFGAWALAQAQHTDIEIVDDDEVSVISTDTSDDDEEGRSRKAEHHTQLNGARVPSSAPMATIGKAGDDIPHFKNHMVRQRVDRHGNIYELPAEHDLPALQLKPEEIGIIKPGPVRKWIAAKARWDAQYGRQKRKVQKQRLKEMKRGFKEFKEGGVVEQPPPSAMASRRGLPGTEAPKLRKSMGLSFWSMMGSNHDKDAVDREEKLDRESDGANVTITTADGVTDPAGKTTASQAQSKSRPGSRRRTISYQEDADENTPASALATARGATVPDAISLPPVDAERPVDPNMLSPTFVPLAKLQQNASAPDSSTTPVPTVLPVDAAKNPLVLEGTNITLASPENLRPKADGVAFPFKLGKGGILGDHARNASTVTLMSSIDPSGANTGAPGTPKSEEFKQLGDLSAARETVSPGPSSPLAAADVLTAASAAAATEAVYRRAELPDPESTPKANKVVETPSTEIVPTVLSGPVRTETPTLEKQLNGLVADSGVVSHNTGATGDLTPKGQGNSGFVTPRAGSVISTAAPSEAGSSRPQLERFETAEE